MKIVTAANLKFKPFLEVLESQCKKLGYTLEIYDLGDLGYGIPSPVEHENFQQHGWYHTMHENWRTKALHKPDIIAQALEDEPIVYLDADAFPVTQFDEVWDQEFDIGVTLRSEHTPILGPINAGVLFFRPSAREAVQEWQQLTQEVGNDQRALCHMLQDGKHKFHGFPTRVYNYYYFPDVPGPEVKIFHFKEDPLIRTHFNRVVDSLG